MFSDHTDVRPTMLALLGLKDSYVHDGRILVEDLVPHALRHPLPLPTADYVSLATAYKQLNAPLGAVGVSSLVTANAAITAGNGAYKSYLKAMGKFTDARDALATDMKAILNGSVSGPAPATSAHPAVITGRQLTQQALDLIDAAQDIAPK